MPVLPVPTVTGKPVQEAVHIATMKHSVRVTVFPPNPSKNRLKKELNSIKTRYRRSNGYLVYFQSYTNTYAGVATFRKIYNEALSVPGVKGLVIGTRPDCVDDQYLI
jgi:radical SAM superfamily enzyme